MGLRSPRMNYLRSNFLFALFAVTLIFSFLANAENSQNAHAPQGPQDRSSYSALVSTHGRQNNNETASSEERCGFDGDQDTYGLGIRIGLYFQWLTSSLAYNFVPSEAVTMRGVNNCFQAAMFAGLLFVTITKGSELFAVEAYLMLLFCMGGVCSSTGDEGPSYWEDDENPQQRARTIRGYAYYDTTTLGSYVRLLLTAAFLAYGLWFVWVGMDGMRHPPCSTYAFFFARVNLYNWFRTFLKVIFTISAIPTTYWTITGFCSLMKQSYKYCFCGGWRGYEDVEMQSKVTTDGTPEGDPLDAGATNLTFKKGHVGFGGALILFIVAVELTIRWNVIEGVDDVGSTGQLLPVILGVGGMGRVFTRFVADTLKELGKGKTTNVIHIQPQESKLETLLVGTGVSEVVKEPEQQEITNASTSTVQKPATRSPSTSRPGTSAPIPSCTDPGRLQADPGKPV